VKDSVKAVSDEEKAQLFNEYFYSVFTGYTRQNLEEVSIPSNFLDQKCHPLAGTASWTL